VLSFFSSRRNWDYPTPLVAGECASPTLWSGGEGTLARGRGGGGGVPIPTRGSTLVLYSIYKYFVTKESSVSGKNVCVLQCVITCVITEVYKGVSVLFLPGWVIWK
jgi:hypothetical protein